MEVAGASGRRLAEDTLMAEGHEASLAVLVSPEATVSAPARSLVAAHWQHLVELDWSTRYWMPAKVPEGEADVEVDNRDHATEVAGLEKCGLVEHEFAIRFQQRKMG